MGDEGKLVELERGIDAMSYQYYDKYYLFQQKTKQRYSHLSQLSICMIWVIHILMTLMSLFIRVITHTDFRQL